LSAENRKALYEATKDDFELGTFEEFSKRLDSPENRKLFFDLASDSYDLGDFDAFQNRVDRD
jgi:hypothetical protein